MEELIKLSQLNTQAPAVPRNVDPDRNRLDLSSIINNTGVEDQILANPELLQDRTIVQNIQTANDLRNKANLLEQRFNTASEDFSSALGGRVFAGPGQRNALAQRRNFIDAERRDVLAALEEVRGNVSTAQSLRADSARLRTSAVNNEDFSTIVGDNNPDDSSSTAEEIEKTRRQRRDEERLNQNNAILDTIQNVAGPVERIKAERILEQDGSKALERYLRELDAIYSGEIRAPRPGETFTTEQPNRFSNIPTPIPNPFDPLGFITGAAVENVTERFGNLL